MTIIKRIAKLIYNIITIFVILLIVFSMYCLIQRYVMNKEYANIFGYTFFQIETGSMSGTIEINDIIIVSITDDVHESDIITYLNNNEIITHRIIKENGDTLTTKGDANNTDDKPIQREQVIGKVVYILSGFGVWKKVFSDWKVIICIIITITIIGMVFSDKDKDNKNRRNHSFWNSLRKCIKHIFKKNNETKE